MAGVVATFAMDIVATQPSTIPLHNGAYLAEEFDDVLCILQPASQSAMTVCQNIWKETPQFILQYSKAGLRADGTVREDDDLQMIGEADTQGARPYEPSKFPNTHEYVQVIAQNAGEENECDVLNNGEMKTDVVEETQPIQPTNLDVALRTSAVVKSFVLGFVFGRDLQKSDIQLSTGSLGDVRISSMHFRIYLNRFGILMLEDTSTNGTTVDEESLGKSYKNRTKILSHSSTIEFVTNANRATKAVEKATFVVKLPKRNDAQYKANLQHYVLKIIRHKQEREQITGGTLFPKPAITNKTQANSDLVSNLDLLSAGTEKNTLANGWTANGKYQVNSELGKGAFAIVYKITTITGGEVQAAKRIDRSAFMKNGALGGKFLNELQIMQKVDHPHIVRFLDHDLTAKHLFIVMEYMPCGDLAPYALQDGYLGIPTLKSLTRQLLHALAYIHRNGIVHRDIKPENVLVSSKDPFFVKLSDFGLSKMIEREEKPALLTFCGTLLYCAPEIYPDYEQVRAGLPRVKRKTSAAKPYSSAVDIWSLGTVIFHLLASNPPFKGSGEDQGYKMLRAVIQDDVDFKPLSVRGVERIGLEFIASMIDIDGELRPSAKDLLRHPWVCHVHDIVRIPNLEESQIFNNPANEVLETLDEEEVWDGLQSESFLKATRALIKTPTPDAPSLTNGETSADDKIPVTENDCSDSSSQINIESVVASQISAELANPQNHKWDNGPATGLAQASQSWFKKSWPSYYAQGDQIAGGASGSEDDTPRQGRSNRLFGEVSQDPNEESSIFGGESQPTIRPLERSQQSPPHNSASLFGTESRMNNLNMKVSRPNKSSVLRSAVTNSMIHGKRYRSTATSGSDESNTSSIDEPAAKRSMVRLSESLHINENTRSEPDPQSLDVNRSLSQQVVNLQLSGTCLATLIPIPGCLSSKEVSLTTRLSTFGRAVVNTNVYEDATDSRIPRSAFDIYFFSPGSAHIRGKEWYKDPDVNAVIMTRCSTGIKVNGCHLPPSNLGNVFKVAKLRTGDLIEVYNSGRNKLVYRCDFHVSESKFPRGADEDVVVEDNTELFEAASSSGGNLTNAGAAEPLI